MRIAILSDIHGNLVALEAVLADIDRQGPFDRLVVAGDLCMAGPHPAEVIARLRSIPCRVIKGNTDAWLVKPPTVPSGNDRLREIVSWTRERLSRDDLDYLAALPFQVEISPARGHDLLVVHANPHDLETPIRPDTSLGELTRLTENVGAEVLAFGHVHIPFVRRVGGLTLVCVGSVGSPLDGDPRAAYAIPNWDGNRWAIEHRRAEYDVEATARDMRHVKMPSAKHWAERLRRARPEEKVPAP